MTPKQFKALLVAGQPFYPPSDPSHDWNHVCRVFAYAEALREKEGGDHDVIAAAVIFHDCVNYPKNDPRRNLSAGHSAKAAGEVLRNLDFPREKIPLVQTCIAEHSFSAGITPQCIESKIVQDADRLESTGIVSLMRTFASCGTMGRELFNWQDPFCESHKPDSSKWGLDLAYARLLKVTDTLNTPTARVIGQAHRRRIEQFLGLLKEELRPFPTHHKEWFSTPGVEQGLD
jgi:uncharacterized protein